MSRPEKDNTPMPYCCADCGEVLTDEQWDAFEGFCEQCHLVWESGDLDYDGCDVEPRE